MTKKFALATRPMSDRRLRSSPDARCRLALFFVFTFPTTTCVGPPPSTTVLLRGLSNDLPDEPMRSSDVLQVTRAGAEASASSLHRRSCRELQKRVKAREPTGRAQSMAI
jgi:hypothetical protein